MAESYDFLRTLLLGLSQYPDVSNSEDGITPWLFTTQDRAVRVQALRAALSLVRSNLSVAIVSRLSGKDFTAPGLQKRGYLETYLVRLRWIVRLAWELLDRNDLKPKTYPDGPFKQINALYRDEIVWLYNELGVVSLAQGALAEALGFLRQAAEFNQSVEGRANGGPIYNHIDLNHALVQLERGRLDSARRRAERVMDATQDRPCIPNHLAEGYLCVLDHIGGRLEGLEDRFKDVTAALQRLHATRASAIMLSHRVRFLLGRDQMGAQEAIKRATELAETGGHEDVRHHCNLISIRFSARGESTRSTTDEKGMWRLELSPAGSRLLPEALEAEATLRQGFSTVRGLDSESAGRIRWSVDPMTAHVLLAPVLGEFLSIHPVHIDKNLSYAMGPIEKLET